MLPFAPFLRIDRDSYGDCGDYSDYAEGYQNLCERKTKLQTVQVFTVIGSLQPAPTAGQGA